ncbi:winged helix-turn-helix transcriptional regulator [Granulicatella sp. zg-ZJ]|uniref:Rrf2 family transcriptional regulator n=1 Tax=unclassified Granulicatella TaxID=2630493 RepID=UPI0013C29D0E|nr:MULTISPECIES: Rrf2 family transcriptional regulator [unclassified Granulicatella]MBS4750438.1 Rrf2 family transcriptional regulator [Carnobacteriaceae bacterium zg-ZUI78]QMI86423.1 Rrf2 family transcriptional regulator [Carnobacteriaceae bacterium zg-84]NEW62150.1 winged helix-turn-helix transcriptional regulator [Granulicatella sp. zg-ZJ]NEW63151.1 winged helix-turn-helix transcriptional regulator [Granulicatella sp. zg-ZJ]NEW66979.1 winged helix-turn-helix transcriptional regulator [Granu
MKHSHKLSDAIHILLYIEVFCEDKRITSTDIAESINTNPALVRQIMSQLKKANLIETKQGSAKPRLLKSSKDITLFDIFQAIHEESLLEIDKNTNKECPLGNTIQTVLTSTYREIENSAFNKMKEIFLIDLKNAIDKLI